MDGNIRHRLFRCYRLPGQKIGGLPGILYGFKISVREHDQVLIFSLAESSDQCFPLLAYDLSWRIRLSSRIRILSHQCLSDMHIRFIRPQVPVQRLGLRRLILLVHHMDLSSRIVQCKILPRLSSQFFQLPVGTLRDTDILALLNYNIHKLIRHFRIIQGRGPHHGKTVNLCLTFSLKPLKILAVLTVCQIDIVIGIHVLRIIGDPGGNKLDGKQAQRKHMHHHQKRKIPGRGPEPVAQSVNPWQYR